MPAASGKRGRAAPRTSFKAVRVAAEAILADLARLPRCAQVHALDGAARLIGDRLQKDGACVAAKALDDLCRTVPDDEQRSLAMANLLTFVQLQRAELCGVLAAEHGERTEA